MSHVVNGYEGREPETPGKQIRRLVKDRHDSAVITLLELLWGLGTPEVRGYFECFGVGRVPAHVARREDRPVLEPEEAQFGLFERA